MSYIAFDLDALNVAADVGRAAGIAEDRVIGGLARMWAWCFRQKTDVLSKTHVKGFFGADAIDALISFNFLAAGAGDGVYRVRGADRYLRVAEGRSRGGKIASGNLKKGTQRTPPQAGLETPAVPGPASGSLPAPSRLDAGPSPNTEHRTPNTEHRTPIEKETTLSTKVDRAPLRLEITEPPKPSPPSRVFDHWRLVMAKKARTTFDPKRRRAVERQLGAGYSVEDLCVAIDGCAKTPHNIGQNDQGQRYDDLELICRDAAHVEKFIHNATAPPRPSAKGPTEYDANYWVNKPAITEGHL